MITNVQKATTLKERIYKQEQEVKLSANDVHQSNAKSHSMSGFLINLNKYYKVFTRYIDAHYVIIV